MAPAWETRTRAGTQRSMATGPPRAADIKSAIWGIALYGFGRVPVGDDNCFALDN